MCVNLTVGLGDLCLWLLTWLLCLPNRSGAALIGPALLVYSLKAQKHVIPPVQKVGGMEGVGGGGARKIE